MLETSFVLSLLDREIDVNKNLLKVCLMLALAFYRYRSNHQLSKAKANEAHKNTSTAGKFSNPLLGHFTI